MDKWYNNTASVKKNSTERYRSGYNGPDSKSGVQQCTEGSNPSLSAKDKTDVDWRLFCFFLRGLERGR